MGNFPFPELGVTTLLFLFTLLVCYCIWYVLLGKRFPLKDKKTIVKKIEGCTLNDIMGYDFIQIKNIKQTPEEKPHVPEKEINPNDNTQPALYATTGKNEHNENLDYSNDDSHEELPEPEQNPPAVLNITDDDVEELANQDWDNDSLNPASFEEQIRGYENFLDDDLNPDPNESLPDEKREEIEKEKAFNSFMNQMYDNTYMTQMSEMDSWFELTEKDQDALQNIMDSNSITSEPSQNNDNEE